MNSGRLISIEGIEGAGKSTLLQSIVSYLSQLNIPVCQTREPGGTPVAESIRHLLLHAHPDEPLSCRAELLLMFASRIQHLEGFILPALAQGQWVICDRFVDASFAYQGAGRGLGFDQVQPIADWSMNGCQADLTFLLDLPVEQAMHRLRGRNKDKIEQEDAAFFESVRNAYLEQAALAPKRFCILDATLPPSKLAEHAQDILNARLMSNVV